MVTIRCKMAVKAALDKIGLPYGNVELGEVELKDTPTTEQLHQLKEMLHPSGLELMVDKRAILIEKIKLVIIEMIHYTDELPLVKNSEYISEKLGHNYTYLANLFSEATGYTIEHFIILHKVERIKELILYDEHSLTEIAYMLNYSSISHLSNQFKKITGLSPSFFKKLKKKRTSNLDRL